MNDRTAACALYGLFACALRPVAVPNGNNEERLRPSRPIGNTPAPARQINAQQNGTAYIWNSTTQELLPILWPDHPQYRENMDRVLAAIRRWNGEAK